MLVHVSPKEEDLCETICTLGFGARVRSIHLGTEDPIVSEDDPDSFHSGSFEVKGGKKDGQLLGPCFH